MSRSLRLGSLPFRLPLFRVARDFPAARDLAQQVVPADRPAIARGQLTAFRVFRSADAPDLLRWGRHADVLLESYNMVLHNRGEAQRWLVSRRSWEDAQLFAVDSLSERRVVGYIGLREIDRVLRTSVLGISFDPAALGCGYGTDALRCFLRHYFTTWDYNAMYLDVAAPNIRAQRCYRASGYRFTGERWKPFYGSVRAVLKSQAAREHPEMFRTFAGNLSVLYYDMCITAGDWRQRSHATTA